MLRLNILLLILIISFYSDIISQRTSEWEVLQSPTTDVLRKLYFVDKDNGWAVGLSGTIIKTNDAGKTWQIQNSNVTTPIVDVFFIDKNFGWAITYPSTPPFGTDVLITTNGGNEWIKRDSLFLNKFMTCIYFFDRLNGLIGGNGVAKTSDGGLSWHQTNIDSTGLFYLPIYDFNFYNKNLGYACGGTIDVAGVIWKTTNGGENWSSKSLSPDQIFDVYVFDSLNTIALSGDPEGLFGIALIKTTDAGETWSSEQLPVYGLSFAIDFLNSKEGWSASGYKLLNTEDGGNTWNEYFYIDSAVIYDLQFVDEFTGFACGQDGALLKFTSYKKPSVDKPTFELRQNYPNPFSEKTKICFTVISQDFNIPTPVKIKLFDILGKEITTIFDEECYWGYYEHDLDPATIKNPLSSGVYIISLISGDTFISKKIIYLK